MTWNGYICVKYPVVIMSDISINNLEIQYEQNTVIKQLSLHIEQGCFFTLLGPSGCGKTTLLRTLAGFIAPASGEIRFGQQDVTRLPAHKRDIGLVFQDYALFPHHNVADNVGYGLKARGIARDELQVRVDEALEQVALSDYRDRFPAQLSGGQKQRVALARALVIKPRLLLMDEPLSNLDARLRLQMRELICRLQRESGITTVFVTHDQEEALAMSDQIAIMQSGKIEQIGTPKEVYATPANAYVADFIGSANLLPSHVQKTDAHSGNNEASQKQWVVRPEQLILRRSAHPDCQQVLVRSAQYLGHKTSYQVEWAHEGEVHQLQVDSPYPHHQIELNEGDRAYLAFPKRMHRV